MGIAARYRSIVKWVLYAVLGTLAVMLQRYVFSRLAIFDITPILMGALAVCVGMFEGSAAGAVYGALCGFAMYTASGSAELLYAAVYSGAGFGTGLLCEHMLKKNIAGATLAALVTNAAACLLFFVLVIWLPGRAGPYALLRAGLPEIAYSTALTPLIYAPVRLLSGLAREKE